MSRAGRDNFGRYIRDDAIVKQAITPMLGALTLLMDQVQDDKVKLDIAAFIMEATLAAGVLDVRGKAKGNDDVLAAVSD